MKVAATEFDYKNCFDGIHLIDSAKPKEMVLHFNVGDELPQILVDRLKQFNPGHLKDKVDESKVEVATDVASEEPLMVIKDQDFTDKELIGMLKERQVEILLNRGVLQDEIDNLKTERKRVKKILETNPRRE